MGKTIQDTALSYDRFSNPKQGDGDSEDRQQRAYASFIQRHDLQQSKEYAFIDRGLSGYDGTHKDKGDLGRLLEIADKGVFKPRRGQPGYVLVLEAWDRLGRLRPDKMIDLIRDLLACGLKIGVCRLDDIFEERDFGTHKWIVLSTFVHLAHQESKQKSDRVKASYQARVAKAREDGTLTRNNLPAWLECVNGEQREIRERIAAIKRIFELARIGCGVNRVIKTLTQEKVPPFGEYKVNHGHKRSQFAGVWTRSYVHLILNDRRVLGEYQPTLTDEEGNRVPDGPPIKGYFKAVIDEDDFRLAKMAQEGHQQGYKGPRQCTYVNVFRGMLKNAVNGEGYLIYNRGSKSKPQLVLVNRDGYSGRAPNITFPYPIFERALLSELREVPASELAPAANTDANLIDVVNAKLKDVREQVAALKDDLRRGYNREITDVLREKVEEEDRLKDELDGLLAAAARPLDAAWEEFGNLMDAIDKAKDPVEIRLRLRSALKRAVASIQLLIVRRGRIFLCDAQVHFAGGTARRDYLILYRAGTRFAASAWNKFSLRIEEPLTYCKGAQLNLFDEGPLNDPVIREHRIKQLEQLPKDVIERLLAKEGQDIA